MADPVAVVVKGPDRELRTRTLDEVVTAALGDDDRTLAVAETYLPSTRPPTRARGEESGSAARLDAIAAALDGARTPPFGTAKRVVVIRTDEKYAAAEGDVIARYLESPEPTTVLVLEAADRLSGALASALKAVKAEEAGGVPFKDATASVLRERLSLAGLTLDHDAARAVTQQLGEDVGRVPAFVDLLASAFGAGAHLSAEDVVPYLGDGGGVPIFELTKAIDAGDVPGALDVLYRMTRAMTMHPLQVMAILHNHFRRILRLDDATVDSEAAAVEALGGKVHAYPAKLAWQRARGLGTDGIRRAFHLLAKADRNLKGGSGAPDDAVLGILVTELAMLAKRGARVGGRR